MADLNIKCPACGQEMVCDSAYAGQEVQCPGCQKNVMVPKPQSSSQPPNSLVPKVPEGTKLAIGTKETHGKGAGAQASHPMNLRKPMAPPKKKLPIKDIAIYTFLVAALGAGGYFGYNYWQKKKAAEAQDAAAQTSAAAAPAPANPEMPAASAEPAPGSEMPGAIPGTEAPKRKPEKALPVIPPSYTLDAAFAKIPQGKVNGTISAGDFTAESIRLDQTPTSQVLRFSQGAATSIDRELLIYLKLKLADLTNGHSVNIASDTRGSGLPQVVKRWRTNPNSKYAPSSKTFGYGYVLKLELGKAKDGEMPGKIYVALPDKEESVIAGVFNLALPDASQMPVPGMAAPMPGMPAPAPGMPAAEQEAFRRRYGTP